MSLFISELELKKGLLSKTVKYCLLIASLISSIAGETLSQKSSVKYNYNKEFKNEYNKVS